MKTTRRSGAALVLAMGLLFIACSGGDEDNADDPAPAPTVQEIPDCKPKDEIATAFNFEPEDVTEKPLISDFACEYDVATDASDDPIEVTWFVPTDTSKLGPVWSILDNVDARCSDEPCEVQNATGLITTQSERNGNTQIAVDTQFDPEGQVEYMKMYSTTRAGTTDCTTWIVLPYQETDLDPYKQGAVSLTKEACGV